MTVLILLDDYCCDCIHCDSIIVVGVMLFEIIMHKT